MSELKNKTIITVATTGAWPTKANNPNVPMTPEEISEDVYACWKAGAAIANCTCGTTRGTAPWTRRSSARPWSCCAPTTPTATSS